MRSICRGVLCGVALLIGPAVSWCDELNVAYFEELAAQTFLIEYRIEKMEGHPQSIRNFAFHKVHMRNGRKNGMFITDMRAWMGDSYYQEKH